MGRSRVLSFMSAFGNPPRSPTSAAPSPQPAPTAVPPIQTTNQSSPLRNPSAPSTPVLGKGERTSSRPGSMVFQTSPAEIGRDTLPELLPIFTFLNSHANKLYQEGYFLKLNDLDISGRPFPDRSWTECFAQLVGTVLSLWDAAALDAAGQDGEVAPTFINLADASIKMIETLPTRNSDTEPLHNVLSISTAGKNRYLLHFNSLHSLTQWTAGIRLAMFEHASLQELYTGSLIAGKGKELNNIRTIMDRTKIKYEDWTRVRFGAGTAWQRYWCVITPPDEKEFQRQQKSLRKRSAYERTPVLTGDMKLYESKKTKKVMPIATIKNAYAAYAIYPQSKPLIEQSTLIKIEGTITIHSTPESTTEGFVFVMPEIHPAVSGFEMMLRTLFPVYDIFGLYGRPNKLIADTLDQRGLMFAMPKERRYGYLDIIDVAALVCTEGSDTWTEREWRKKLKEYTSRRMTNPPLSRTGSRFGSQRGYRNSLHSRTGSLRLKDDASVRSASNEFTRSTDAVFGTPKKSMTGLPGQVPAHNYHSRSASETLSFATPSRRRRAQTSASQLSVEFDPNDTDIAEEPPLPPAHLTPVVSASSQANGDSHNRSSSDDDIRPAESAITPVSEAMRPMSPPAPVTAPPAFAHQPSDKPQHRPSGPTESQQAKRMSTATLNQMSDINNGSAEHAVAGAAAAWKSRETGRGVNQPNETRRTPADHRLALQGITSDSLGAPRTILSPILSAGLPPENDESPPRPSSSRSITRKPVGSGPASPPPVPRYVDAGALHEGEAVQAHEYGSYPVPRRSFESRARPGVLKTVGGSDATSIGDTEYMHGRSNYSNYQGNNVPQVDFGPTQALTPSIPANGVIVPHQSQFSHSQTALSSRPLPPEPTVGTQSSRPSSRGTPWQPGAAVVGAGPSAEQWRSLTPEEFVQERAGASSRPPLTYGHVSSQSRSSTNLPLSQGAWGEPSPRKELPPRPHSRGPSLDWVHRKELPPRPHTRGGEQSDYNSHLSAREQEHVARMTGTPLVNFGARDTNQYGSSGLVGAIEAREQEKQYRKEELSGQLVQEAANQRHLQTQAQMQAQQAANMAYQPVNDTRPAMPGSWTSSTQQGTQWTSPQAAVYWGGAPGQSNQGAWDHRAGQYYGQYPGGRQ